MITIKKIIALMLIAGLAGISGLYGSSAVSGTDRLVDPVKEISTVD